MSMSLFFVVVLTLNHRRKSTSSPWSPDRLQQLWGGRILQGKKKHTHTNTNTQHTPYLKHIMHLRQDNNKSEYQRAYAADTYIVYTHELQPKS